MRSPEGNEGALLENSGKISSRFFPHTPARAGIQNSSTNRKTRKSLLIIGTLRLAPKELNKNHR